MSAEMFGYSSVSNKDACKEVDLEAGNGETLYPGLSSGENQLRWGLIRKVYGILAAQLVLTTIVSAATVLYTPITDLLRGSFGFVMLLSIVPFICKYSKFKISPSPLCFFHEMFHDLLTGFQFSIVIQFQFEFN